MANHPKYDLKKSRDNQFYFNLTAANGQIILSSERYTAKGGAENGITSVKKNSAEAGQFEKKEDNSGQYYFVLKAKNHEVIGRSESYTSSAARDNGIESVMTNGPKAETEDNA